MWLLPHLSAVSGAAVRVYYRASRSGEAVPRSGPVLLVGNHPNSLLDPAFLAWVARRPVRFLAKATLFTDPLVGWIIRASGSIPVYRKQDDPALMDRNEDTFRAVHAARAGGSAVALFPEGTSHSDPTLAPLKTGAARIALGAAGQIGGAFPIIPVGLVFRAKDRFRSQAHAVVGTALAWDDLAARGVDDREAVHELTARIDRAMRGVTLNLARWEDEPVVRTAEAVWAATHGAGDAPETRVARLAVTTDALAALRAGGDAQWDRLARDVREHARVLRALGVRPRDVQLDTNIGAAARWALRRFTIGGTLGGAAAALAIALFWLPYRVTGFAVARMHTEKDTQSTYRVFAGFVVFTSWIVALAGLTLAAFGWLAGAVALVALPALAIAGLHGAERWRWTLATARNWMLLRRGDPRIASLRDRQLDLSRRLDAALAAHSTLG